MEEVADVADGARQHSRYRQSQRRPRRVEPAQCIEVRGQGACLGSADVELAVGRRRTPGRETDGETRQRLAEIRDVEGGHAAPGSRGQRVHGPARDAAEPPGAVAAVAIEQRRPHDEPVGAAGTERLLARELGGQESAARPRVEPEHRDVNQRQPARPAGLGQRGRRPMVHALIGLAAALAQDADAVEHDRDAVEQAVPVLRLEQSLEVRLAARAVACALGQALVESCGATAADDGPGAVSQQGQDRVPPDEARGTEHEHDGPWGQWLRDQAASRCGSDWTLLGFSNFLS